MIDVAKAALTVTQVAFKAADALLEGAKLALEVVKEVVKIGLNGIDPK